MPGPVRRGGLALKLYENSLSLTLFVLFLVSFLLHCVSGAKAYSREQLAHGEPAVGTISYMAALQF